MYWLGDVSQGLWDWGSPQCSEICTVGGPGLILSIPTGTDHPSGWKAMGMPSLPCGLVGLHRTEWQVADSEVHPSTTLKLWAITFQGFSWLMRSAPRPSGWGSLSLCASLSDRSLLSPVLFNFTISASPPPPELPPRAAPYPRTVSPPT